MPLKTTSFTAAYCREHAEHGLSYLDYGTWQQSYGQWLVEALGWSGREVLDCGCCCGSITYGLREAGAHAIGIDVNECAVAMGREKWPAMSARLHVCDLATLHFIEGGSIDGFHASQVLEHIRPRLVPIILEELRRVAKPGALFFASVPRHGMADDGMLSDPTHHTMQPLEWWHERLAAEGWQPVSSEYATALSQHPSQFITRYEHEWDWFIAKAR